MSEILAPCGGYESLAAALNTGADAVYVGMKQFSARKNAENFSDEELAAACRECHKRGVKLYVALNTLMFDEETEEVVQCIKTAARWGVDGLIMQDLGAARIAEKTAPRLPRHASTQMTLNSVSGVNAAAELGYSRVVLGRELSFEQIKHIAENTKTELELFVHGALCVCISGQCYMSSVFGGRSGNRGLCAQPCRLDFTCGERHSVISLKDSSLISHLPEFERLGIASYKIEGRMKRPEYVACAADACYSTLRGKEYDRERLEGIFSRGGLTDGYFTGTLRGMQGTRGKEDVENSAKALNGIKALYKDELARLSVDIHTEISAGEPIYASAKCGGIYASVSGDIPQQANNAPTDEEAVCSRMAKLGGTQFFAGEITAEVDEGLFVPAASLNALRRELCEKLSEEVERENTPVYDIAPADLTVKADRKRKKLAYRAEIATADQLSQALALPFELVYAPITLLSEDTPEKDRIAVLPPLFLADCEDEVRGQLLRLKKAGFTKGTAMTLAHAKLLKDCGFKVYGGFRMNITNSLSAAVCAELGFEDITLSFEGTAAQLAAIKSSIPAGIIAYGRLPLMVMRRCPIADGAPRGLTFSDGTGVSCVSSCNRRESCGGALKDRRGNEMPVLCGGNTVELLNPDTLILSDRQNTLAQFDFAVLKFTTETELAPILKMYQTNGKPQGSLTRGLYFRGAE